MSPNEIRDFCKSVQPYALKIQVRMKQDQELLIGKITALDTENFHLMTDGASAPRILPYAWVARIRSA